MINPELNKAMMELSFRDSVVRASILSSRQNGENTEDTLAQLVLNLAQAKANLESELLKLHIALPPAIIIQVKG